MTARDAGGNLLPNQAVTLAVTSGTAMLASSSGMTDAAGAFSTTITSTEQGVKTVRATIGAATVTAMVTFTP